MASSIPTNMDLATVLMAGGVAYITHHCWAYDRFKCLLPTRKDWFKAALTWMLIASNALLFVWSAGYSYLKHKYWYMHVPDYGIIATPLALYSPKDLSLARVLNVVVTVALWLQVSLNAEEGMYWYHLMRAVRKPRSARAWLNSNFFIAWVIISVTTLAIQLCATLINVPDEVVRAGRLYSSMGTMEVTVALAASIVIIQFPRFLEDVKRSGAGREVRTRLYSYHEANKLRTFFRLMFALCAMILGYDGLTARKRVNTTRWAAESIEQLAYLSYFAASLISVTLYLPRTYSAAPGEAHVLVGRPQVAGGEDAVSNALMSLLREGGHWDEVDDKRTRTTASAMPKKEAVEDDDDFDRETQRNSALDNFISPIAVAPQHEDIPSSIRIHVKQEVVEHRDGGSDLLTPGKWA